MDPLLYSGHSFQRGAASAAAAAVGYTEHEMQLFGRWRSDAYKLKSAYSVSLLVSIWLSDVLPA